MNKVVKWVLIILGILVLLIIVGYIGLALTR